MEVDVVVTTRNRLGYLTRTLEAIRVRTRTPHVLHVVDDASDDEMTPEWLWNAWRASQIDSLALLYPHRGPIHAQGMALALTHSDPVVLCDDDVLCPDVEPDWLARLVAEMARHSELAMLALRHPGAKVKGYARAGAVTYCRSLGATFCAVRREFLAAGLPSVPRGTVDGPMRHRCATAEREDRKIGHLTETYCYHLGRESVLTGEPYRGKFIEPTDWRTLEPPEKYRG